LTTSRSWGTYDDDEATAIDAIVDAVLEPWRNVKIEKHMVEDAMYKVNEVQDAACFLAQHVDGKLYVVGEQDERASRGKWNPGRLFHTRRRNALQLLQRTIDAKQKDGTTTTLGDFEALSVALASSCARATCYDATHMICVQKRGRPSGIKSELSPSYEVLLLVTLKT